MSESKIMTIHIHWPEDFKLSERKIIGEVDLNNIQNIRLVGYLEYPGDPSQTMRAEVLIPCYIIEQCQELCRILDK